MMPDKYSHSNGIDDRKARDYFSLLKRSKIKKSYEYIKKVIS